jgi:anti-sigma factor ChrR (cupin superfamily)
MTNGDLTARALMDTRNMPWSASPSDTVWRKRVHLVGPAESGQVTSVVRCDPGATFPEQAHPGGEEILILDGVFSDEHGDWPQGSYLLNPDGFRNAPFSRDGCAIFVNKEGGFTCLKNAADGG